MIGWPVPPRNSAAAGVPFRLPDSRCGGSLGRNQDSSDLAGDSTIRYQFHIEITLTCWVGFST